MYNIINLIDLLEGRVSTASETIVGEHTIGGRRILIQRSTWKYDPGLSYDILDANTHQYLTVEESFDAYPTAEQIQDVLDRAHAAAYVEFSDTSRDGERDARGAADFASSNRTRIASADHTVGADHGPEACAGTETCTECEQPVSSTAPMFSAEHAESCSLNPANLVSDGYGGDPYEHDRP